MFPLAWKPSDSLDTRTDQRMYVCVCLFVRQFFFFLLPHPWCSTTGCLCHSAFLTMTCFRKCTGLDSFTPSRRWCWRRIGLFLVTSSTSKRCHLFLIQLTADMRYENRRNTCACTYVQKSVFNLISTKKHCILVEYNGNNIRRVVVFLLKINLFIIRGFFFLIHIIHYIPY